VHVTLQIISWRGTALHPAPTLYANQGVDMFEKRG
jgi:hypothetical protein